MNMIWILFPAVAAFPGAAPAQLTEKWPACGWAWDHAAYTWYGASLAWLLFFFLLGVGTYLVFRLAKTRSSGSESSDTPLEILRKRYAGGEITRGLYEETKRDLESGKEG